MTTNERIKEIREATGLKMTKFAEKYGIPYRTIQNWEGGVTEAPEYVLDLLAKVVATDQIRPHVWVFREYRDKAGTGREKLFGSSRDAISYASQEWHHMSGADRLSYLHDPAGVFCVGLAEAVWEDVGEEWVTEPDLDQIVWDAMSQRW